MAKGYRLINHTADTGIEVWGNDMKELLLVAAMGMVNQVYDVRHKSENRTIDVRVSAVDADQLMIKWLQELLYIMDAKKLVPRKFNITKLTPKSLQAEIGCEELNPSQHGLKQGIKAVTYHDMKIEKVKDGLKARIIFDI